MLPIEKSAPPQELLDARRRIENTPDTTLSWRSVTHEERLATLRSLLREQGDLCAYCMRHIDEGSAHVEHIVPQSAAQGKDDPSSIDYWNLLAVCDGFASSACGQTCDRARGDQPLAINPLHADQVERVRYRRDGTIYCDGGAINNSLDRVLNLNQQYLKRNRMAALRELNRALDRRGRRGHSSVAAFCARYVNDHLEHPSRRIPYDGIIIYFMRRRMRAAG